MDENTNVVNEVLTEATNTVAEVAKSEVGHMSVMNAEIAIGAGVAAGAAATFAAGMALGKVVDWVGEKIKTARMKHKAKKAAKNNENDSTTVESK